MKVQFQKSCASGMSLVALMLLVGCDPGGRDVCAEALGKVQSCLEAVDCASFDDPELCLLAQTTPLEQALAQSGGTCDEAEAEALADCPLDPGSCACLASQERAVSPRISSDLVQPICRRVAGVYLCPSIP